MTGGSSVGRIRARLDRLPAGWAIVLVGFLVQFALVAGQLGLAYAAGSRIRLVGAALAVGVVLTAGVAALPAGLLLFLGRLRRGAAALAVLVAAGTLVVSEARPSLFVFPAALFVAAVRVWAGAGLDAAELLRLDPDRFERVDPHPDDGDGAGADSEES